MKFKDLVPFLSALGPLVAAIIKRGRDPAIEIPRITRSYESTARIDKEIDDYLDERFAE